MNRVRRTFTSLPEGVQFFILSLLGFVAAVVALVLLTGCSTLTDQVYTPALNPEAQERCVIVYDHVRWNLAKDGECRGEARI